MLPNSIGPEETVLSIVREPREVRLADGEPEGEAGDSVMSGRRLLRAAAGAGDSWKNEPNPGESPVIDGD